MNYTEGNSVAQYYDDETADQSVVLTHCMDTDDGNEITTHRLTFASARSLALRILAVTGNPE